MKKITTVALLVGFTCNVLAIDLESAGGSEQILDQYEPASCREMMCDCFWGMLLLTQGCGSVFYGASEIAAHLDLIEREAQKALKMNSNTQYAFNALEIDDCLDHEDGDLIRRHDRNRQMTLKGVVEHLQGMPFYRSLFFVMCGGYVAGCGAVKVVAVLKDGSYHLIRNAKDLAKYMSKYSISVVSKSHYDKKKPKKD